MEGEYYFMTFQICWREDTLLLWETEKLHSLPTITEKSFLIVFSFA